MTETATSTPTITELRARAVALGYKTIHKRGKWYEIIAPGGRPDASYDELLGVHEHIDATEAKDARLASETDLPDFDSMSDDEIALHVHKEGDFYMTCRQRLRADAALATMSNRAKGIEVLQSSNKLQRQGSTLL